ncbi:hypothetical protein JCM33374_g2741 [Metschnikowia sp. JCM 33374]|nr:hypothetical protein JCM33374_g2741 [Metschnikowia sp. JCM 33374]
MCIDSDHVDLTAAKYKLTVAGVTELNVQSVVEHMIMTIFYLVRNFVPAHEQAMKGRWDIAAVAEDMTWKDLEGKVSAGSVVRKNTDWICVSDMADP